MCEYESKSLPGALCNSLDITVHVEDGRDPEKSRRVSCPIVTHHAKLIIDFYRSLGKIHQSFNS